MRRQLINQDAFDRIISESVTTAQNELEQSQAILAKALGSKFLRLKSFTESTVLFESGNGTYVHAGYEIKEGKITFTGMKELIVDEQSQREKRRSILSEMIDSIIVDETEKAKENFNKYLNMVAWTESDCKGSKKEKPFLFKSKDKKQGEDKSVKFNKDDDEIFKKAKKAGNDVAESYKVARNVLDYVEHMTVGPALAEAITKFDEKGNLVDIKLPVLSVRNENHYHRSQWKALNSKVAEGRRKVNALVENQQFCKAIAELKKQNAFSDAVKLEESIDNVVKGWPEILFATQDELALLIAEALNTVGATNYDDETCTFMAEGVLRKAHETYKERIAQILHLASSDLKESSYEQFQNITGQFYSKLDEKFSLEKKLFADLYESVETIYKKAERSNSKELKREAAILMDDLSAVLNDEVKADLSLASEAAEFLVNVIETNLESGEWIVSNKAHTTLNGDHPITAKKASQSYTPSKDASGDWSDPHPAIDDKNNYKGKEAKTMREKSWGQEGGNDVYPNLKNPYLPKPFGDYTMNGEKGVDKENDQVWGSGKDVYPNLTNPYLPKEAGDSYKMNNGKDTDLVVDK